MFVTDRWTRYQWGRATEGDPKVADVILAGTSKQPTFRLFAREVFGRLFADELEPLKVSRPEDAWAVAAHQELGELPEFDRLRRQCRADRLLALTASTAFSEKVAEGLPTPSTPLEDPEPLREQVRALHVWGKEAVGSVGEDLASSISALRERGRRAVSDAVAYAEGLDASQVRATLRGACKEAQVAADALEGRLGAFCGWGESGGPGPTIAVEVKAELAKTIGRSAKLQQLAREAGRMRRIAATKQRSKSAYARDEVTNIGVGDDLGRLLPSELVRLVHPILGLEVQRRLLERGALQYELGGKEPQGRGPIVVCIDESSSMEGPKEVWAKAVALALLEVATLQRRACRVLAFNTDVVRVNDWAPGKVDPRELLRSMEPFAGGGTRLEPPLSKALEAIRGDKVLKRADVVLITDGEAEVGNEFREYWYKERRTHELSCYCVHVDAPGGVPPRALAELADVVIGLADLAHDGAATDAVLGI